MNKNFRLLFIVAVAAGLLIAAFSIRIERGSRQGRARFHRCHQAIAV
jgi:hypothetical protein